jgi:hypothetical protein
MATLTRLPSFSIAFSSLFLPNVRLAVWHLVSCPSALVLTRSVCRKPQRAYNWQRHIHVNGTIYYGLETQDQNRLFRRVITEEDITDPDIRKTIEDGCDEYHQWLEEADLEDLPDDLELLIHFDNPYRREPIASFISYQKEVKFSCCPMESENEVSVSTSSRYIIVL